MALRQLSLRGSRPAFQTLVEYASGAFGFYAEHYRAVPSGLIALEELDRPPAVSKPELVARFDDWVTDAVVS